MDDGRDIVATGTGVVQVPARVPTHEIPGKEAPTLPPELLMQIVEDFRPVYLQRKGEPGARHLGAWQPEYFAALHSSVQLRLVNRAWNKVLIPLLYTKIVIHCTPRADLEKRFQSINHFPHLITTLVLCFTWDIASAGSKDVRQQLQHYITACLMECINLKELEFVEPDRLFRHIPKGQIQQIFRHLSSNSLSSLIFRFNYPQSPSHVLGNVLCGLGAKISTLRELEVIDFYSKMDYSCEPLCLPPELSSLEELTLHGLGSRTIRQMLARVTRARRLNHHRDMSTCSPSTLPHFLTSLQHLTIVTSSGQAGWNMSILPTLLAKDTSIGSGLLVLRLDYPLPYLKMTKEELAILPIAIVQACPSLQKFLFFVPFVSSWFQHIPPRLDELGVFLAATQTLSLPIAARHGVVYEADPVIEMVTHEDLRHNLRRVSINMEQFKLIRQACSRVGIQLIDEQILE
ncbi:hypothetical protein BDN72DRAFT_851094 [Pluteus cervinus]|uniref:Uncharacterized protein n=1 Tax=Pluteus cervinus TaxID=181527 RepID=A0ACD3A250_9AGAR|nr:hypothetical protein BDN72DRAFT_851094 [Pluteus cervinus]